MTKLSGSRHVDFDSEKHFSETILKIMTSRLYLYGAESIEHYWQRILWETPSKRNKFESLVDCGLGGGVVYRFFSF